MSNYVCYHLHTELSLLDSCTNHKLYSDRAAELGQKAICFSEHGNIYSWIEKKMYANSKGLKYLHGCEVYLTEQLEEKVRDNYHTILIAKNYDGFKELNLLIDKSTQPDHFYYKPRITFDEFFNISDNIIKISACLASPLFRYPKSENADKDIYDKLLKKYDYYEIQPHIHPDQVQYNQMLFMASQQYGKPLIAGTDTHSIDKYKAECRSILQKAKNIQYADEDKFDLTYKSYDELVEMFKNQASLPMHIVLEAIENTNVMADSVEDFELDTSFKYPRLADNEEEVLKRRINRMFKEKLQKGIIKPDPRYKQMILEEMRVFKKIGMVGFMLFMSKLTCWCWEHDIPVGFCRGSVGGSMIAYITDIIDVNPLQWGTMFSRFANEDRKEIGDIDVDISPDQRQLVYDHIIEEYGSDKTAYVLAIGTISDKGTIDDVSRALAKKFKEEGEDELAFKYSLENTKEIKKLYESNPDEARNQYPELFYYFDGMVNTAISQSMHPAGIIVSPVTLPDNYGVFWNDNKRIMAINMEEIHEVSLVKYDILGLKSLAVIRDCCKLAGIKYPKSYEIDWNDSKVWEHIVDSPVGIFQMESNTAYSAMKKMGCHSVDDLSLVNACIRPSGESYRDRLLAGEWNKNPSEMIDNILEASHGFLAYQEQVISFLQNVCGMSGSEADNTRRAIGRKQLDRLQAALPKILDGYCAKSDKPRHEAEEEARTFLKIIEDSSNYMFGYNHSTGYSMIGYLCGYLRYYYPTEFITAYLNNANNDDDIQMGTQLAKQFGISIQSIKFRHSESLYNCDAQNKIIYKGIASIKYMNDGVAKQLNTLKENKYESFVDLLVDIKNLDIDSRQLDILIKLDYFEEFGDINYLLEVVKMFDKVYGKKQLKIDSLETIGIPLYIASKYCQKQTAKILKDIDSVAIIKEASSLLNTPKITVKQKMLYESTHLGYIQITLPDVDPSIYYLVDDNGVSSRMFKLYQLRTGDILTIKCQKKVWARNPVHVGQFIYIIETIEDKKWGKTADGEWYRKDETEQLLTRYEVLR